ncbi:MAG: chloride channel protein [Candidatus Thorarchaeota archaeon]|nr:MAG: chloride channel protein [Candidatus Thorarchaeota archaeon]
MRNQRIRLYTLAALVGVISGVTAIAFRGLILVVSLVFVSLPVYLGSWGWLIAPAIGGLLVSIIVKRFAHEAKGHGVPELIDAYALRGGMIRARVPLLKSLASAICIGSGGSCGREGPIAQIGGGAGSALASFLGLNRRMTKTLLVCGTASGIAATFNAPLGGALFGIEIVAGGIAGFPIVPIILSSVIATALADAVLGTQPSFQAPLFYLDNYMELAFYLTLGLILGIMSVLWSRGFYQIEDILERMKGSKHALTAFGGLLVGALALLALNIEAAFGYTGVMKPGEPYFPAIMGVGYAFVDATLLGLVGVSVLVMFGLLKFFATSITLGSGGSGGVFAPTLFIGAAFGGAFGLVINIAFPEIVSQPMAYALVGMAALFAGSGRAPITCIVMLMEMTNDYSLILPLMAAVSMSYLVSSSIEVESIYTLKLARRGIDIKRSQYVGALREVKASQVMTASPTILKPDMTVPQVLRIVDDTHHTKFPVVDSDNKIVGTLITENLFGGPEGGCPECLVRDLMNVEVLIVSSEATMDSVLHGMLERDEGHAVVVDPLKPERMIGFLTKADVLSAYELAILRLREDGEDVHEIDPLDMIAFR